MYLTTNARTHLRECRSSPLEPVRGADEYLRSTLQLPALRSPRNRLQATGLQVSLLRFQNETVSRLLDPADLW